MDQLLVILPILAVSPQYLALARWLKKKWPTADEDRHTLRRSIAELEEQERIDAIDAWRNRTWTQPHRGKTKRDTQPSRVATPSASLDPTRVPDVITLVHGTFANDAEWIQPESILSKALRQDFPVARIQYFRWSGDNSHDARFEAGSALAAQVEAHVRIEPHHAHAFVAHSHGGNVVLYALRSETVRAAAAKIVFLGTPFLHCSPRELEGTFSLSAKILSWLVLPLSPLGMFYMMELLTPLLRDQFMAMFVSVCVCGFGLNCYHSRGALRGSRIKMTGARIGSQAIFQPVQHIACL